jgi:F-type H+-transporting ATPase subunit a
MEKEAIHITLSPYHLFDVWGFTITSTLIMSWLAIAILCTFAIIMRGRFAMIPGKVQVATEALVGGVYDYVAETLESKALARKFLPILLTIFLFILTANLLGLFPGVGSIGVLKGEVGHEHLVPLFYPAATDLNVTIALGLIAFVVIEVAGVASIGFLKYAGKFVNFSSFMGFVVGIIELISEVARLISFSFRLFGNIFAGKVLILVVMFFVPFIVPVPLMLFEVFVGFIQAAIFALLTLFFIKIAITEPH